MLMTSGLVPISPDSMTDQPKARHCSDPWAVREGERDDWVGDSRGRGLRVPLGESQSSSFSHLSSVVCNACFKLPVFVITM